MMNATTLSLGATVSHSNCCMCQKELTDAASIEAGSGPWCRGKMNEALARTFSADWEKAVKSIEKARASFPKDLADLEETWGNVQLWVLDRAPDQRASVKRICWMLSRLVGNGLAILQTRTALFDVVEHLGYRMTATLLRGMGSTGKARMVAAGGRVHLVAPRCKFGGIALRQIGAMFLKTVTIPGVPKEGMAPFTEVAATWSVTPDRAQLMFDLASTYWLGLSVDSVAALIDEAKTQVPMKLPVGSYSYAPKTMTAPIHYSAPKATITVRDGYVWVKTPFLNAAFTAELKVLPWGDRTWITPEWRVHLSHEKTVRALVAKHFGS